MVIGGGLASIDVIKAVQVEVYETALRARGIETSMLELEHKGIPAVCAAHGLDPGALGVEDCRLYYRRRAVDMPLAAEPENATQAQIDKVQVVRQKILSKVLEKFRVSFFECHLPVAAIAEGGRLAGLRFVRTKVEGKKAAPVPGSETEVRTPLVISSIGSIPEPIPGIEMKGDFYSFKDWTTGQYAVVDGVFGVGNVVTGQGNIAVSQKHATHVAQHLIENYLGIGDGAADIAPDLWAAEERTRQEMEKVQNSLRCRTPLPKERVNAILDRVRGRMKQLGYTGYREWINRVTPPDLE